MSVTQRVAQVRLQQLGLVPHVTVNFGIWLTFDLDLVSSWTSMPNIQVKGHLLSDTHTHTTPDRFLSVCGR